MPPASWSEARLKLVHFFSRGRGLHNAEDLAHDTLAALWSRDDYEFRSESEFGLVCYGLRNASCRLLFAGNAAMDVKS